MNKQIIFFTARDAALGFRLAGFDQRVCTSEDLISLLEQVVQQTEYGLIVIDERLITETIDSWLREMEHRPELIFVIMPPPLEMEAKREDYALRLLRKAIGYHIQLNL